MTTTTPLRRSTRARHAPKLQYTEELELIAEKKRQSQESQSSEGESESDEEGNKMPLTGDDSDDDAEDFESKASTKKSPPKRVSPPKARPKAAPKRKIKLKTGAKSTTKKTTGASNRRSNLPALAKKVLDETETPENCLVAALLATSKPIEGIESVPPRDALHRSTTIYTPQLEGIVRKLLRDHEPNSMHIQLLNLMFRSVGGSVETNFEPATNLEDLSDGEWDNLMTQVVDDMMEGEEPLLTANLATLAGPKEYRLVYFEFWYRLGNGILNHNAQEATEFSSNRFQVEMLHDLVARLSELVMVGQPDLRAAATIAIWQLSIACMERTVELEKKVLVATRQSKASKTQNRKLQAVKHAMDAWKRSKAELEEIVETGTFNGVFIHRYRDSNPQIRVESLNMLSRLAVLRPDLFLRDRYLKYFGWMASDKVADVRVAALKGLLAPFRELAKEKAKGPDSLTIDVANMHHVCTKFLNRIIDSTEDSQSTEVQELAMELLLAMLQNEFLDEWEDDDGWDQINLKALDARTTQKVRRDALYFILEQLHSFDAEDDNRSSMSGLVSDKKQVERLDGIASWVANKLAEGNIAVDKIRVSLADLVVQSMRDMKEHKHLVVNWSAMLKAIRSENPQQGRSAGREEVTKQRVLLRMLACAAKLEAGEENPAVKARKKKEYNENQEALSVELLKNLPHLLPTFKGDNMALRSLTQLPKYLIPAVFSLPARKSDFSTLVKNMCRLFLDSTDDAILSNISQSLANFVEGDHTRVAEVRNLVKKLSTDLHDRLMELLREGDPDSASKSKSPKRSSPRRRARSSRSTDGQSTLSSNTLLSSPEADVEHSIYLCLKRWRMLLKACPLTYLFDESTDDDEEVEGFCNTISEAIGKKLADRKPYFDDADSNMDGAASTMVPKIWSTEDATVPREVASAVDEALQVLLCVIGWKLLETLRERSAEDYRSDEDSNLPMEVDVDDLAVLRMRNRLSNLLGMCFDQYLPDDDDIEYTTEHEEFAVAVQASATRVASDTRTLFPREWSKAKDPVRKALALTKDSSLIGGTFRYFQSREHELHEIPERGDANERALVSDLLLPLARSSVANWKDGHRNEAGLALCHITGSGLEAAQVVQTMARLLKKIHPVRFLEAELSSLRLSFEAWANNDPEHIGTDRPTEEQLQQYEDDVKRHNAQFAAMETRASRLSTILGFGKLSDPRLRDSMPKFMQEGVRYAFEGNRDVEDDLVLGSRLPFLTLLSKFSSWIKKNKQQRNALKMSIFEREEAMQDHPEFDEVHEDDLAALDAFKASLGITEERRVSQLSHTQDDSTAGDDNASAHSTPRTAGSKRRQSTASSQRSRYSTQSNLSPLYEEDGSGESDDHSPSPQKRRRLHREESPDSGQLMTKVGRVQERIEEEDEPNSDVSI